MGTSVQPARSVLMVVHSVLTHTGGAEIQAARLTDELRRRGWKVTMIGISPSSAPPYGALASEDLVLLKVPRIPVIAGALLVLCFAWYLFRNRRNYEVIHVHIMKTLAFTASIVGRYLGKTVVIKVSGYDELDSGCLSEQHRNQLFCRILNCGCRKASTIAAISLHTRDRLLACGYSDGQIRYLPNGIDLSRFRPSEQKISRREALQIKQHNVAVSVGRLVHEKGLFDLLDSWRTVLQKHPDSLLCIVGDGPYRDGLRTVVKADRLLEHNVAFMGASERVEEFYGAADCYASASLTEGLSNTMLEAMASGLPIVCTEVSGAADVVEDGVNGFIVPIGCPDQLAAAIGEVFSDTVRAHDFGHQSRKIAERLFDLVAIVDQYEELYSRN